ncbi:PKD domain-containing protein [Flavobacteriales bacterium]|jgi:PKD repeat protein|nr:PKD domain-containing protein [Flavobacteriales bacterium]
MKKIIYLFILSSTSLFGQLELENLLAHYSFDGNCNVETTHEFINNGLHSGTEEYAPGINGEPNSAIRIKNNSEDTTYVDLGYNEFYNFGPTSQFSISLWVKTYNNDGFGCILVKGNDNFNQWDYGVITENGKPYIGTNDGNLGSSNNSFEKVASGETIGNGQWNHLVITYNDGYYKLFVNNELKKEKSDGSKIGQTNSKLILGKKGESDQAYYDGFVDELKIFSKALSNEEVKSLYDERCVASFQITKEGKEVTFQNTTEGTYTYIQYNFGDGNFSYNPGPITHTYEQDGIYEVCIRAINNATSYVSESCNFVMVGDVENSSYCQAEFQVKKIGHKKFNFIDQSLGNRSDVTWDFNRGEHTSSLKDSVEYEFPDSGYFEVCLSIYDEETGCNSSICKTVAVEVVDSLDCRADFNYFIQNTGDVSFNSKALGTNSAVYFSLGDGFSKYKKQFSHRYQNSGNYNVCMSVYDSSSGCQDQLCKPVLVNLDTSSVLCEARMDGFIDSENIVHTVNKSIGNTHSHWDFGDGIQSFQDNPTHEFTTSGYYNICLNIHNSVSGCQSSICKELNIKLNSLDVNCLADFEFIVIDEEVTVTNTSLGSNSHSHWTFERGSYDDGLTASYTYEETGLYEVCLSTWDSVSGCQASVCKQVSIIKDTSEVFCSADFDYIPLSNGEIQFNNVSTGEYTDIRWDLGNGIFGNNASPIGNYPNNGVYPVTIMIWDRSSKCQASHTEEIVIVAVGEDSVECHANFEFFPTSGSEVVFKNISKGTFTQSFWKFSDGSSSYEESPTINFTSTGLNGACLTMFDSVSGCQDKHCAQVPIIDDATSYCYAHFEYYVDSRTVYFDSEIKGGEIGGWIWDYDDGYNSNDSFPSHTYEKDGVYEVCLTVYDSLAGCFNTYCDHISVLGDINEVEEYVHADFTYFLDTIDGKVYFKDESVGNPSDWYWDFGDGDSAGATRDPIYEYEEDGYYEVCLTARNGSGGQETKCEVISVGDVSEACFAKFDYYANALSSTAHFDNKSLGDNLEYDWGFGDSALSIQKQPSHYYADTGLYKVRLTVSNDSGCIRTFYNKIRVGNALENKCLVSCVWPGDANLDLEVNHYDILPIGLHYGETGPSRSDLVDTVTWKGYESQNWTSNLWGDVNNKNGDANGDGIINFHDMKMIENYFSYSRHPNARAKAANQLSIDWDVDDIFVGETAVLTVSVPDSIDVSMYGLGFEIDLDPNVFDYESITYDYSDSWLKDSTNDFNDELITFEHEDSATRTIYIAESRIDHNSLVGNGVLVRIGVNAIANASNVGVLLSTDGGVTAEGDTVTFAGEEAEEVNVNSIEERGGYLVKDLKVFPNPTNNQIAFNLPTGTTTEYKIELFDNVGALVYSRSQMNGGFVRQSLKGYESGVYTIQVSSDKIKYMQKVIVMK